jgi:hypothetical protein
VADPSANVVAADSVLGIHKASLNIAVVDSLAGACPDETLHTATTGRTAKTCQGALLLPIRQQPFATYRRFFFWSGTTEPSSGLPKTVAEKSFFLFLLLLLSLSCSIILSFMKLTKELLEADPRIERLLKNPNWRPAAEAAVAYLLHGTECPIISWRKSSTWAQVKMVYDELSGGKK